MTTINLVVPSGFQAKEIRIVLKPSTAPPPPHSPTHKIPVHAVEKALCTTCGRAYVDSCVGCFMRGQNHFVGKNATCQLHNMYGEFLDKK